MSNTEAAVLVICALIAQVGVVLPVLISARNHARQANEAVNCRPEGKPKLADVVDDIAADVGELKSEVAEVRQDQALLAVAFGEHLSQGAK